MDQLEFSYVSGCVQNITTDLENLSAIFHKLRRTYSEVFNQVK